MAKPKEIIEIEQHLNIRLEKKDKFEYKYYYESESAYKLNKKGEVTSLKISGHNLSDVSILLNLKQLRELDLSFNQISEIKPIEKLTQLKQLTQLDLSRNQISDIKSLEKLTQLKQLSLNSNDISDIKPLEKLTQLTQLNLDYNQISDIKPLEKLTQLKQLSLNSNNISDFKSLEKLTELTELNIYSNNISDFKSLEKLTQLTELNLGFNQVSDIKPLEKLTELKQLRLDYNQISDFKSLEKLTGLTELNLGFNQISDIKPLEKLTQLKQLSLDYNQISDFKSLEKLTQLAQLNLNSNNISNIKPLEKLTQLKQLSLNFNQISDFKSIEKLTQLTRLNLGYNNISDFKSLEKLTQLTQLTQLSLNSNNISDIKPLEKLTELTELSLNSNNISDIKPLEKLMELTGLSLDSNQITNYKTLKAIVFSSKKLYHITVSNNSLAIPTSCLNDTEQLRAFFRDGAKGATEKRAIKLLFLGDGCVGKSTLLQHLKNQSIPDKIPRDQRTEGIQIDSWKEYFEHYTVNAWDFGGQEVLHSTHRLFLGERAVYVLVWCKSENKLCTQDEVHPLSYWLDFIADFGKKSTVLLVENVINQEFSNEFPDEIKLQELINHYRTKEIELTPTHYKFDCLNDTDEVMTFKDVIKHKISNLQRDYPIENYPKNWYEFQLALEKEKANHKVISIDRYIELAMPFGLSNPIALLDYFNDIGVLGYFNDLKQLVILQMGWVLDAIYGGLKLKDNVLLPTQGKLNNEHFELIWLDYTKEERAVFIAYMLKSNLIAEPSYGLHREYQYLVPALFNKLKERDRIQWEEKEQYVTIQFKFIFTSIMQQLQVRILSHCHYEEEETFYKNYISFTDKENNYAYIELCTKEKELRLFSKSDQLINTILNEVNEIYPLERVSVIKRKKNNPEEEYNYSNNKEKLFDSPPTEINKSIFEIKKENKVFVTYSWTNEKGDFDEHHQNKVGKFVNQLIEKWGLDASFDLYQGETNFIKMMYKNLHSNNKIIIVLSEGYAVKADSFKTSGVETEFTAIVNDIKNNPDKYILVTFDSRDINKFPYGLKGNDTIVLKEELVSNYLPDEQNRLLSKLTDDPIYVKPQKASITPTVRKKDFNKH